ncbi:MAG: M28 family peptidase [Pyrinomonadaceae bacterium]
MKKFNSLLLALAFALLPFSAVPQSRATQGAATAAVKATSLPPATVEAAKQITAARLREHLTFVAADARGGRDTPSQGLDETAQYIADDLKKLGFKPAGDDGTFFQHITLRRDKIDPARTTFALNDQAFKYGDDFLVAATPGTVEGQLVFVGNGWMVKSKNIDAFKGVDVKNKIMIVAGSGLLPGMTRADVSGKAGVDYDDAASYGKRNGALGLIVVPRTRDYNRFWTFRRGSAERGFYQVEKFAQQNPSSLPTAYPSQKLLDALFAGESVTGADVMKLAQSGEASAAFALAQGKRAKFSVASTSETATTQNVVAILEGRDAQLKGEYVALGAHYDHIGTAGQGSGQCQEVNGDKICNGADDDGSGTVSILTIAEAFARGQRPRRSLLFVWHCGEEKGLWGSQYFTNYPTVPLERVVTQLNIDMIGRSRQPGDTNPANRELTGPDEIYVIGSKMMSTDLGDASERVNAAYMSLAFNYKYDDPHDPHRFFFRSDHFNYAQKGVPIIFYFDGEHEDYHRPSDQVEKIDFRRWRRSAAPSSPPRRNSPTRPRARAWTGSSRRS